MVGRNMSLKYPVTPPGIDHGTVRLVAKRLNHYATPHPQTHGYSQANLLVAICKNKLLLLVVMCMHNHYFMLTKLTALVGVNAGTIKYLFVVPDSTEVCKKRSPNMPEHQTSSISTSLFCHTPNTWLVTFWLPLMYNCVGIYVCTIMYL